METYYDDALVTLKDGDITVDGVKVAGSVTFRRDPRLSHLAQALMDMPPMWKAPRQMAQVDSQSKWCYCCGDVRPKSYFAPDKRNADGLDSRCKGCEAERQRRGYQAKISRPVRAYTRQVKAAV